MQQSKQKVKRGFTEAARSAALVVRRAKAAQPKGNGIEIFAVRPDSLTFAWEIRRFGGIVLVRSDALYATPAEALSAGRRCFAEAVCH